MKFNKRERAFNLTGGKCYYCGCELSFDNFHLDHFIARAKGGTNENNLVPSCVECNLCKNYLTLEEFRTKLSKEIFETFQGKMFSKYYDVKPKKIIFYFERGQDGNI